MTFTNAQTAFIFEWIDASIWIDVAYHACLNNENFGDKIKKEAEVLWHKLQPNFGMLSREFHPIFWDEIGKAFTEKYRLKWFDRPEAPFDVLQEDFV